MKSTTRTSPKSNLERGLRTADTGLRLRTSPTITFNFDFEIDRRSRSYLTKTIMVIINALTQVALPAKQLQQLQSKAGAQTRQRGDHDNGRAGNGEDDYNIVETSTTIIIDRDHGPPS